MNSTNGNYSKIIRNVFILTCHSASKFEGQHGAMFSWNFATNKFRGAICISFYRRRLENKIKPNLPVHLDKVNIYVFFF